MKNQKGVTLVTVVIMIIVISIIATASIVASKQIFGESKESVLEKNKFLVETAVAKYAAKASTSGVLSPANEELPGIQNPIFRFTGEDNEGNIIDEDRKVGEDWYLLLEEDLEKMGITYADQNYLVNYKENIVIPLAETDNVFGLISEYEANK